MQVTETSSTGLKREWRVVVPQGELSSRFHVRLKDYQKSATMPGFRKGKVPEAQIKKMVGRSLMAEVLEDTLNDTSRKAMVERGERPAMQPSITLTEDKAEIERVMTGQTDLAYTMKFEALPKFKLADFSEIKLEREVVAIDPADVEKALGDIAKRQTKFEEEAGRAAVEGDQVKIDFVGKIDGVAFEGGKADDVPLVIGAGGFIPGFEDGIKGATAGTERAVSATFPDTYQQKDLAGKTAIFDVKVKSVSKAILPEINDEFAKTLGLDDMGKLREIITTQIQREYQGVTRQKLKRHLLDALDKSHAFELPESLVTTEFDGIWGEVERGMKAENKTFPSEGKTEDEARAEYRKIAERRVRLGLVIGEVGDQNKVQVTEDELRGALIAEARRYPGQEKFVFEYYQKNQGALVGLRAPIFEDKVVDLIISKAQVSEKAVTKDELVKGMNDDEEEGLAKA